MTFRARRAWTLPAILALGLALRLWVATQVAVIAGDGITRIGLAKVFRDQGFEAGIEACLVPGYHPFNPILIRLVGALTGDLERAGFAVSILFGILAVLAMYLLGREVWGEREGLLAALVWALLVNAVHFSADVLTEGQFMAFWILAAWSGLRALRTRSARWALGAGVLAGLAYETRVEGVGIALALGIALAALAWRDGVRPRARQAVALALGFLLLAVPYLLSLRQAKGEWMLTPSKRLANLLTLRSSVWKAPARPPGPPASAVPAPPPAPRMGKQFLCDLQSGLRTVMFVLPFSVLALWRRRPWGPGGRFLLGLGLLYAAVLLGLFLTAGYISQRHVLTLTVVAVAWAAAFPGFRGRAWAVALLCAVLAAQTCHPLPLRGDKAYRRDFGVWLAAHAEPDAWVAALSNPEIAYYARRRGLDWAAAPTYYLDHPDPTQAPQWLVLDLDTEDRRWIPGAAAHPQFARVPLPAPHDARFAVFRRDLDTLSAHSIIPRP